LVQYFQFRVRAMQAAHDVNIAVAQLTRATGTDVAP
jgi:hypothetical protein